MNVRGGGHTLLAHKEKTRKTHTILNHRINLDERLCTYIHVSRYGYEKTYKSFTIYLNYPPQINVTCIAGAYHANFEGLSPYTDSLIEVSRPMTVT